jgi:hypothetical protein
MIGALPSLALDVTRSTLLVLPLAVVGAGALRRDAAGAMLGLWAATTVLFAMAFRIPDLAGFLVPIVLVIVLMAGVGMEWITDRYLRSEVVLAMGLAVVAFVALALGISFVDLQSHDEFEADTRLWLNEIPENAVLAANYPDAMAAFHLSLLEDTRTDVITISDYPLADPEGSVLGRYLAGETVEVPHTRSKLEPGRPVFAPGQDWACELVSVGFGVEPYRGSLFRVVSLGDASPFSEMTEACR